ncbi:hypothetical protein [Sediminibacterium soli]|uniref:hypothetical protein n=1 Tax=Sediminibacterium soli TaxID=2698829 RepID=UPI00137A4DC1|nr:hypothetical protein [Sediminibacterium soli]NCI47757.1 hypothetical protein [Sediminibacterium soli]
MRSRYAILLLIAAFALASATYILAKTGADKTTCEGSGCTQQKKKSSEAPSGGSDVYEVSYHHYIVSSFH